MITSDELAILRKPEVQEYLQEKLGNAVDGDMFYDLEGSRILIVVDACIGFPVDQYGELHHHDNCLIIPDCISRDSERPERGLIGMLDGFYSLVKLRYYGIGWRVVIQKGTSSAAWRNFDANIPRLALLKALEWQIEQEGRDERT